MEKLYNQCFELFNKLVAENGTDPDAVIRVHVTACNRSISFVTRPDGTVRTNKPRNRNTPARKKRNHRRLQEFLAKKADDTNNTVFEYNHGVIEQCASDTGVPTDLCDTGDNSPVNDAQNMVKPVSNADLQCPECDFEARSSRGLKQHISKSHASVPQIDGLSSPSSLPSSPSNLQPETVKTSPTPEPEPQSDRRVIRVNHQCPHCNYESFIFREFYDHVKKYILSSPSALKAIKERKVVLMRRLEDEAKSSSSPQLKEQIEKDIWKIDMALFCCRKY